MDSAGGEKPANFHDRLYEALQMLVEFIHAEGLGLTHEAIKNDDYWRVEQRLQYHKTSTEHLIDLFYMQRFQEQVRLQNSQEPAQYGTLSVRVYLNHDSLCVEVLRATNVIPLDPNGFSDPFVIIELLPRRIFPYCNEQQTHVHKVRACKMYLSIIHYFPHDFFSSLFRNSLDLTKIDSFFSLIQLTENTQSRF